MKIQKIKNRSVLFTRSPDSSWNLNIHLIQGNKFNYIIDTGLGSLNAKFVKEYIQDNQKPIILINTHYHWDHVWGNSFYKECMIV